MAVPRVPILVGLLALAGAGTWIALRDRTPESQPDVPRGSAAGAPSGSASRGAVRSPDLPSLAAGSGTSDSPAPTLPDVEAETAPQVVAAAAPALSSEAFAAQDRDPRWASDTESAIRRRLAPLSIPLDRVECRHDLCELTLAGEPGAVDDALAKLETPTGLAGLARSMLLTAPITEPGRLTVRAYALFER